MPPPDGYAAHRLPEPLDPAADDVRRLVYERERLKAELQGAFVARIGELRVRGAAVLQGAARLSALITGKIDGEVVFNPSPLAQITASLNGVVQAGADGELFADVPKGRLLCVIPAMQEAVKALASVGADAQGTIEGQLEFASVFQAGG